MPARICSTSDRVRSGATAALFGGYILRLILLAIGVIAVLVGLVWIGQGAGFLHYPASSFMINQPQWAFYGIGLAIVGAVLIGLSRWR